MRCRAPCLTIYENSRQHRFSSLPPGHSFHSLWAVFQPRPYWLSLLRFPAEAPGIWSIPLRENPAREDIIRLFGQLYRQYRGSGALGQELAANALERVLLLAADSLLTPLELRDPRLQRVLNYIQENLSRRLGVADLAKVANLSPSRFAHVFVAATGYAPMDYVERARLEEAKALLLGSGQSVTAVAAQVGYTNQFHFSTRFRNYCGQSPSAFRHNAGRNTMAQPRNS